jgi:hypothetical protein
MTEADIEWIRANRVGVVRSGDEDAGTTIRRMRDEE